MLFSRAIETARERAVRTRVPCVSCMNAVRIPATLRVVNTETALGLDDALKIIVWNTYVWTFHIHVVGR